MTTSQDQMCRRLRALGLTKNTTRAILDMIQKWTAECGPEWTVSRLKDYKNLYIHQLAGKALPETTSWIALRKDGIPKGPLGRVWKMSTHKERVKALNTLMVYTSFISPDLTEKQLSKFSQSVQKQPKYQTDALAGADRLFAHWAKNLRVPGHRPFSEWPITHTRVPVLGRTVPMEDLDSWLEDNLDRNIVRKYYTKYKPFLDPETDAIFYSVLSRQPRALLSDDPRLSYVGNIGFIQEPGFKLRAVANPNRIVQYLLHPMKDALLDLLRGWKYDCTHNQERGIEWVQKELKSGKTVHSIDLSDATNNMPLCFQIDMLKSIFPPSHTWMVDMFHAASRGAWAYQPTNGEIRWTVGQPLGLGPSFPAFALIHHAVMFLAIQGIGLPKQDRDCYRILGDDIVISNDKVAKFYRKFLEELDCPVSESKTISSDQVAEFAGAIITPEGVIRPAKFRQVSDRSFLDFVRNVGHQAIGVLRPRQARIAKLVAEIPEEYGGLGFNPKGKSYKQRIQENLSVIRRLEDKSGTEPFTRDNSLVKKWMIEHGLTKSRTLLDEAIGSPPPSAEERPVLRSADSVYRRLMESIRPHKESIPDTQRVPEGYYPSSQLSDPRGTTTLESMERKLKDVSQDGDESDVRSEYQTPMP